jgi:tRNA threonylcarbamoyl adenosine modification protein (Sua5/YciO/YrdC/YwlC family)
MVMALLINIYEKNPQLRAIKKAVEVVTSGGLIVYPTDTIYGLGCALNNKRGIEKLYRIKEMDDKTPLSLISPNLSEASKYSKISNITYRLMNKFLPGPFTFILPAKKEINKFMLYKRKEIGIRVPDSNVCRVLTEELGSPVISTSVPLWGDKILNSGEAIHDYFGNSIDLVLDIGILISEQSTIVDLTQDEFKIVRQGKGEIQL